ncbi:hypothetical protein BC567DRAFT_292120 [Phyllosticta citribraziliensis]
MAPYHKRDITPTESDGGGSHLLAAIHQDCVSDTDINDPQLLGMRMRQGTPADSEYSDSVLRTAIHQDRISRLRSDPAIPSHDKVLQWNARAQLTMPLDTPEPVRYTSHDFSPAPKLNFNEAGQGRLSIPAQWHANRAGTPVSMSTASSDSEGKDQDMEGAHEMKLIGGRGGDIPGMPRSPRSPIKRRPTPLSHVEQFVQSDEAGEGEEGEEGDDEQSDESGDAK